MKLWFNQSCDRLKVSKRKNSKIDELLLMVLCAGSGDGVVCR